MFPGDDHRCGAGRCQKIVITERQILVIPAAMIHMVETHSESVARGVSSIHRGNRLTAARVFRHKRKDEKPFSSCYPAFPMLALNANFLAFRAQEGARQSLR